MVYKGCHVFRVGCEGGGRAWGEGGEVLKLFTLTLFSIIKNCLVRSHHMGVGCVTWSGKGYRLWLDCRGAVAVASKDC